MLAPREGGSENRSIPGSEGSFGSRAPGVIRHLHPGRASSACARRPGFNRNPAHLEFLGPGSLFPVSSLNCFGEMPLGTSTSKHSKQKKGVETVGRVERARKYFFFGAVGVFLAGATAAHAGPGAGAGETPLGQSPVLVVEELRLDLSDSLRGDLIAAMRVEIAEVVANARQAEPAERPTELAGEFRREEKLALSGR